MSDSTQTRALLFSLNGYLEESISDGELEEDISKIIAHDRKTAIHYAGVMCHLCAHGDVPEWRAVFGGFCHIWESGNGHSACAADRIWEALRKEEQ